MHGSEKMSIGLLVVEFAASFMKRSKQTKKQSVLCTRTDITNNLF